MSKRTPAILTRGIATLAATLTLNATLRAVDGTWNTDSSTNWSTAGSWASNTVADGAGSTANFRFNITATRTVTLDTSRTIGNLVFEDLTTASNDWVLSSSGGSILTLSVVSGTSGITVNNRTATINTVLEGTNGITTAGAGTLILAGANTFTGGLTLSGATNVQLNNNTAANLNDISFASAATGRLVINGGVTIGNNINIGSGITNVAGRGLIEASDANGQATVNGTINITGSPTNGGILRGGLTAGNELVINGAINSTVPVSQRDGRVVYKGGGNYTSLLVTNTAIVGANNGINPAAVVTVANSGTGTLDLGTFNQTLAGVTFAATAVGTVTTGTGTLTLNGNVSSSGNFTHNWNGNVDLGGATRNVTVGDGTQIVDLQAGATFANGTLNKIGTGTLALNGTSSAPVTVNAGVLAGTGTITSSVTVNAGATIAPGNQVTVGTFTTNQLTFGTGATSVSMNVGAAGDLISGGNVTTNGTTTINAFQLGGALANGTYNLISYTGTSPGLTGFTLAPVGHATASLVDTGTAIALSITGNDKVIWDGANTSAWATGATGNWKLQSNLAVADYIESDDVIFQDGPTSNAVTIATNVTPSNVAFTNTSATTYTVSGAAGIFGTTGLQKSGNGTTILANPNSYIGATTITGGTLELDHDATGNVVLSGTSGVSVATGATLRLSRDDGGFTFNRNISGTGTVDITAHSTSGSTTAQSIVLSGTNTGFTGTMRLLSPVTGTYRLTAPLPSALGGASIEVQSGAQIFTAANQTYTNNVTIAGTGFADSAGNIGALRLDTGSNWAGNIVVNGSARIGAHNTTATVSGNISGGDLTVNATNFNNNYTLIFTGNNSYGQTIIGGQNTQTSGTPSMRLNIGNGGTTGTLGSGNVTINGDSANGVLGFDRSDGYTLLSGQTITGAGSTITRTFIDIDTRGAGFSTNGNAITLGSATAGGSIRVAQARAGAIMNIDSTVTAGTYLNGSTQLGTTNLNAGANLTVGSFRTTLAAAASGSVLNINSGATLSADTLFTGDVANGGGTVNQAAGSTVSVTSQLRVGHFATETSTYNLNGGTLTLTGASPLLTPSTAGAGGANATGDNNINALATPTVVGGGIYLGIDGTGVLNQNNGTLTTNWIVLDNRGDTGPGTNMVDGVDRYNLLGGTLNLRSTWGLIQRNNTAAVSFAGGTVRVDNTGTGGPAGNTGANINIPLDANIAVSGAGTVLDTNGAGNGFTLPRSVAGNGTLTLTGGGAVNLSTTAIQNISANLASSGTPANLVKLGTGTTNLTGSGSGYTGAVTVSAGRLNVQNNLGASSITVADGATLGGEPTTASATLGATTGASLFFDPTTPGALTATSLTANGVTTLDFTAVPGSTGPWTALNYTTKSGAGTFALANASSYRSAPVVTDTGSSVTVSVSGSNALTWTGTGGSTWDVNTTSNWNNTTPAADKFFAGDTVTFDDSSAVAAVTVTSGVSPWKTSVTSSTTNYTFTSTTNGIAGPGNLEKSGTSTLTLVGPNTYSGQTIISGGTVSIAAPTSLGNASLTNGIVLNGGKLNASAAMDLGSTRSVSISSGGGTLSTSGSTALTVTVSGNLSGTGDLTLTSGATAAPTYVFSGDGSGFTGNVNVNSTGATSGATTLRLTNSNALTSGTVSLAQATVAGQATTLDVIGGVTIGSGVTVSMNSNNASNFRSTLSSSSVGATLNGPIVMNGDGLNQINSGSLFTLNGNVSAGGSGFTGTMFIRGGGTGVINGSINLPNGLLNKTDGGTWTIASPSVTVSTLQVSDGTMRLGGNNIFSSTQALTIGQASSTSGNFDLNGFNQTFSNLTVFATSTGTNNRVTNGGATASLLTLDMAATGAYSGLLNDGTAKLAFTKTGTGTLTLSNAGSTFTGNVEVNGGTLIASALSGNTNGALGAVNTAGRTITINSGATLSFTSNNIFGNGVANTILPSVAVNSGTLTSTRYNVLGDVTLNNATLTQSTTDAGTYEGFQFRGNVTVGGTSASTISTGNGTANHLGPNTTFNVADATNSAATDLLISAPLRNQSGDFAAAIGALTKTGPGTLELSGINTYTGTTTVNAGTLLVTGSLIGSTITVNVGGTLGGNGTIGALNVVGGTLAPGTSPGTLTTGALSLDSNSLVKFELAQAGVVGGVNDLLSVSGAFTLDGTLQVTELPGFSTGTYRLANYAGALVDNGLSLEPAFLIAHPGSFVDVATPGQVDLVVVPEPGTLTALLGGMGLLVGAQRYRRRR